jgi:hypothetical protein
MPLSTYSEHIRVRLHEVNAGGLKAFPAASYLTAAQELGCSFAEAQRILDQHGLSFRLDRLPRVGPEAFEALETFRIYRRGGQAIETQAASIVRTEGREGTPFEVATHVLSRIWDSDGLSLIGCEYRPSPRFRFATKANIENTAWILTGGQGNRQSAIQPVLGASGAAGNPDEDPFL